MIISIKVIPSTKNEWIGWFGDNLIKLRLIQDSNNLSENLLQFLEKDLGIKEDSIKILNKERNHFQIEIPDIAWELFLTVVK